MAQRRQGTGERMLEVGAGSLVVVLGGWLIASAMYVSADSGRGSDWGVFAFTVGIGLALLVSGVALCVGGRRRRWIKMRISRSLRGKIPAARRAG